MITACFVLGSEGSDPHVTVRCSRRASFRAIYSGPFREWDSMKSDIKKYGRCIVCIYEGEAVLSIDRTKNKEIASDLMSNVKVMAEVYHDERNTLLFVDRTALTGIRRSLEDSDASIIAEHLAPDDRLLGDDDMARYYDKVCRRELSLLTGTIDERRMLTYRLSRLKRALAPSLCIAFALSLTSSIVSMRAGVEKDRLSSLMKSYSSVLDRGREGSKDVEEALSSLPATVPCGSAVIVESLTSEKPPSMKFRSIREDGDKVVIDAMACRSKDISDFSRRVADNELFKTIEISEVTRSKMEGYIDFRMTTRISQ